MSATSRLAANSFRACIVTGKINTAYFVTAIDCGEVGGIFYPSF
ncbi:hypothetical protein CEPID_04545 [Corynebacterium epidermidicanis]|uniref:Uncharacterized protein n=1 Tax=Corynebacterium epidermidicanis TaxID=1050174 RepID=A0A0G3GQE5_9CORY|nr:hypothetical protein CEPID_04545 [Corynebacterium epidermidicanis]